MFTSVILPGYINLIAIVFATMYEIISHGIAKIKSSLTRLVMLLGFVSNKTLGFPSDLIKNTK